MKNGIAVVGRVAKNAELLDGQTVKTKTLCQELERCYPDREIICVDTYQYKKHFFSILFRTVQIFINCEHIFVLLSRNGRTFFFPILTGLNFFFHRRLYHDVVGGALPGEARERRLLRKQLTCFEVNWVETRKMKEELAQIGVKNVEVLPNFKRLEILSPDELIKSGQEPFVFTMLSRVIREKGMGAAAEAISEVNRRFCARKAVLHIYGPVAAEYEKEFQEILEKYHACVSYFGCVPSSDSVKTLKGSFMLLFPSVYPGEGIPGTIIDAFSAGLPVIATDWHFNGELVQDGVTGYCYHWKNPDLLAERIAYAVEHPDEIDAMRPHCLAEARKYTPDLAMEKICRRMQSGRRKAEK